MTTSAITPKRTKHSRQIMISYDTTIVRGAVNVTATKANTAPAGSPGDRTREAFKTLVDSVVEAALDASSAGGEGLDGLLHNSAFLFAAEVLVALALKAAVYQGSDLDALRAQSLSYGANYADEIESTVRL